MKLIIYSADCKGVQSNCLYPHRHEVSDPDAMAEVVRNDHVCAAYKGNYRGKDNFIVSNCVVMDVDNDHTDEPSEWITPEALAKEYPDIRFAACASRNHMRQKESRGPRPRFHVYFEIDEVTDQEAYSRIKRTLHDLYPFYDGCALDAGRFVFGSDPGQVYWQDGGKTILSILDQAPILPVIQQGSRNRSMYSWAVRAMKRAGDTEETKKSFYKEAERCMPPLSDQELQKIWESAARFYMEKVRTDPAYVGPQEYGRESAGADAAPAAVSFEAKGASIPVAAVSSISADASAATTSAATAFAWDEPVPFNQYNVMPFPVDVLPAEIAAYVRAVAESTQTPVDMAGTAALAAIAACIQGKYKIQGKADWLEPLCGYFIVSAPPSERKSAVEHCMVRPLDVYERRYNTLNAGAVEASRMHWRVLERQQRNIEDQVAKGSADVAELDRIAQEIADFEEVRPLQLYVDDITTEKLVSVMADNNGRMALISSEGGIFDTLAGAYSKSVNIDVMLKGYSGETIRVDRIGRESERILDPALTILLMVQPSVLLNVIGNQTFRGRGFTARFLYSMPVSFIGKRNFMSAAVPDEVYQTYESRLMNLLENEYTKDTEIITLSDAASDQVAAFAAEIELRLADDLEEMSGWAGKLVGNVLRLAGLLCRAGTYRSHDILDDPDPLVVDEQTMEGAIRLGRYFLSHAQAVFNVLPDDLLFKQAEKVVQMLKKNSLPQFDRRDVMRICRSFKTAAEVQAILDILEEYGYIAQLPSAYTGTGRPPLPKYAVNPMAWKNLPAPDVPMPDAEVHRRDG